MERESPRLLWRRNRGAVGASPDRAIYAASPTPSNSTSSQLVTRSNPVGATMASGTGIAEQDASIRSGADKLIPTDRALGERHERDPTSEHRLQHPPRG